MLEAYLLQLFQHEPFVFNTYALDLTGFEEIGLCGIETIQCLVLDQIFLFCAVDGLSFGEHQISLIFVVDDIPQPRYELVGLNLSDLFLDREILVNLFRIDQFKLDGKERIRLVKGRLHLEFVVILTVLCEETRAQEHTGVTGTCFHLDYYFSACDVCRGLKSKIAFELQTLDVFFSAVIDWGHVDVWH